MLDFGIMFSLPLKLRKVLSQISFAILSIYLFYLATTTSACILCLLVFQNECLSLTQIIPQWLNILLIILLDDVHQNPGPPFHNSFFNVMSWNVNSIGKDGFQRVRLIEAHNSIFNYDLISICETSLNDSIKLPTRLDMAELVSKNSLPIKIRNDLSFNESIVAELNFGRKKFFFTVLYRSPAFNHTSPEFNVFLSNFTNLYSKIKNENPYASFFTGDFNGH